MCSPPATGAWAGGVGDTAICTDHPGPELAQYKAAHLHNGLARGASQHEWAYEYAQVLVRGMQRSCGVRAYFNRFVGGMLAGENMVAFPTARAIPFLRGAELKRGRARL